MACFNCFQKLTPRWKGLLTKIYPRDPAQGLRKAYMEKLMYYVAKNPEKVDKMGKYMHRRLLIDLQRHRYEYCKLTMEAVDEMLRRVSDSHALNMLAGPYLEMIKALLEERDSAALWLTASESFAKFANFPEDTPSHHRTCDFLIDRFTALCFFSADSISPGEVKRVRVAGIKGVRGVIRKTMKDTLQQTSFWNQNAGEKHLEMMVPALIFNIESGYFDDSAQNVDTASANEEPSGVASDCFKELIGNVPYTHVKHIMDPLLIHFDQDNNRLWRIPRGVAFATHILKIVINHVKEQSCYLVVEAVLEHLLKHCRTENNDGSARQPSEARVRTAIANVFRTCCLIVSATLTNPSTNEILRKLVSLLQRSVMRTRVPADSADDEAAFQGVLLSAITDFASSVQDFQKIQLIEFMLKRVNEFDMQQSAASAAQLDTTRSVFRKCMLETMLKVASTYETRTLNDALTRTLLDPLLQLAVLGSADAHSSLLAEKILLALMDRSRNRDRLLGSRMRVYRTYDQIVSGGLQQNRARERDGLRFPSHPALNDTFFLQNHADWLFRKLVAIAIGATNIDHFEHLYAILSVLYLEIAQFDFVADFYRLLLALQAAATRLTSNTSGHTIGGSASDSGRADSDELDANQTRLVVFQRSALLSMVASLFSLSACMMNGPNGKTQSRTLFDYVMRVIDKRAEKAPFLLADVTCNRQASDADFPESLDAFNSIDDLLFDADILLKELRTSGLVKASVSLVPPADWLSDAEKLQAASHQPDGRLFTGGAASISDTQSINSEMSSIEAALIEPHAKLVAAANTTNAYLANFENRPDDDDTTSIDDVHLADDLDAVDVTSAHQSIGMVRPMGEQGRPQRPVTAKIENSQRTSEAAKQNRIANLIEAQRAASTVRYEILDKLMAVRDENEMPQQNGTKMSRDDTEDDYPNLFMY